MSNIAVEEIATIGITNQREITVLWDKKSGNAIHNVIVWQDRRTADHCNQLKNAGNEPNTPLIKQSASLKSYDDGQYL